MGTKNSLDVVYTDPRAPGSFGGARILKRYGARSDRETKNYLSSKDTYTLHKPRRIRFPRRKTYSKGIADLYQVDLADLSALSPFNDGMRYLLTCIDVFSKRAWAVPIGTKSARNVVDAFEKRYCPTESVIWCRAIKTKNFSMLRFSPCCKVVVYIFTSAKTMT